MPHPRADTIAVFAKSDPENAWSLLSSVEVWTHFSPYFLSIIDTVGDKFKIQTPDGIVFVTPLFDARSRLLDHLVVNPAGEETMIPYRIVANGTGCVLMMTNIKAISDTDEKYERQLDAIRQELISAAQLVDAQVDDLSC